MPLLFNMLSILVIAFLLDVDIKFLKKELEFMRKLGRKSNTVWKVSINT